MLFLWRYSPREARDLISKIRSCTVRSDLKNKQKTAENALFLRSDLTVQDRILEIRSLASLGLFLQLPLFTQDLAGRKSLIVGGFSFAFSPTSKERKLHYTYSFVIQRITCKTFFGKHFLGKSQFSYIKECCQNHSRNNVRLESPHTHTHT